MTKRVAVLLTVFNRKEKTLQCLKNLYAQLPIEGYSFRVYLTNDGCTDGTPDEVMNQYPEVQIVAGDGTLFWNRGMYTAWEAAAKDNFDFYLWLNDDVTLLPEALYTILQNSMEGGGNALIVGAMCSSDRTKTTYGGRINETLVAPNGSLQECQTINGNLVLVSSMVYNKVGNLDWTFSHAIGDLDYGFRVREAGCKVLLGKNFMGICDSNPLPPIWKRLNVPIIKRLKNLYSPLGYTIPSEFFYYERRHLGMARALFHYFTIHLRAIFPSLWKFKK